MAGRAKENLPGGSLYIYIKKSVYLNVVTVYIYIYISYVYLIIDILIYKHK